VNAVARSIVERMKERLSIALAWRVAPASRGVGRGIVMESL
jgi:hypothetical protein